MKLGARILLGYATVAVAAAAMTYWSFAATRTARRSATIVTRDTVPSLEALGDLRCGGLRVVASVTEFACCARRPDSAASPRMPTRRTRSAA